ncbi:molybdopterin-guanine dinucleotide biosynthesis protein MobC [Jannaschia pagri]|uniref:Molybdopterin-guanine dinucleotide biosynthesis protein MobC n=1 Tax=Jannaschia pagri TaxID=2829797 RepID=A0ABQ4NKL0_9RHOB|nr:MULTISPECIES: GNAT family N-acetyltransferase [unclassified Jannaschia]GIT91044.1 molybdopterin-guanine dinucleotide biosynthesis protein MobC [Jannaschia sp. AI_61]GIT94876.1 molybdopterin-guanine dinucleotide biosynthesis protein MobC [Jannaschia sp. AI_62]
MTQVRLAPGFPKAERSTAARLYWQAFGAKLARTLGPTNRAEAFFADCLDPAFALGATDGGRLVGLAGFKTAEGALTGGGWGDLARHYGQLGALWRAPLLSVLDRPVAPDTLLMDGLCVDATQRGRGLGTRLLSAVKDLAAAKGLTRVRLDVIDSNPRARALYERSGFVPCGTSDLGILAPIFGFRSATRMEACVTR